MALRQVLAAAALADGETQAARAVQAVHTAAEAAQAHTAAEAARTIQAAQTVVAEAALAAARTAEVLAARIAAAAGNLAGQHDSHRDTVAAHCRSRLVGRLVGAASAPRPRRGRTPDHRRCGEQAACHWVVARQSWGVCVHRAWAARSGTRLAVHQPLCAPRWTRYHPSQTRSRSFVRLQSDWCK